MRVAVVIPAYNEEPTLGRVVSRIQGLYPSYRVIVVNDGSEDRTREVALESGAEVLTHVINRGVGASVVTGITRALELDANIIVSIDADLQHDPADIQRLIEPIMSGEVQTVIGSRFLNKEYLKQMPLIKRIGNGLLTTYINFLSGKKVTDSQSGFRAFSKDVVKNISIVCDGYGSNSDFILELAKKGAIKEIPIKAEYDLRSMRKGTGIRAGISIFFQILAKKLNIKR